MIPIYKRLLGKQKYRLLSWNNRTGTLRDEVTGELKMVNLLWFCLLYHACGYYSHEKYNK